MTPDFEITNAEIWRVVTRIEKKFDDSFQDAKADIKAAKAKLDQHDIDLAVMRAEKSTVLYVVNGLYLLVIAAIEWFHK